MKTYARHASARWLGTRQRGKGAITTPSAALQTALHPTDGEAKGAGTNPAELLAAALAGSFSLTLADELGQAGYHPREIDTMATVTLEHRAAGATLTQILLAVTATVPRAAECDFVDAALRAKAKCPLARALNANVSMRAHLNHSERPPGIRPQPHPDAPASHKARKHRRRRNGALASGGRLRGGR